MKPPTLLVALAATMVAALTAALCMPFLLRVDGLGDEGIWLHAADRMMRGERLYTDFFEFIPPGSFLLVWGWFELVSSSFLSVRMLALATTVATACFTFLACVVACRSISLSATAVIVWVVCSQSAWGLQINHHSFTTLFSMVSAWSALKSLTGRPMPLLSGVMAGAAGMVTPTRGALIVLASATAFVHPGRGWSKFRMFVAGCVVVPSTLLLRLAYQGSLTAGFEQVILFAATRYSSIQAVAFGTGGSWERPFGFAYLIVVVMFLMACVLDWPRMRHDRVLRTSAALALASVLGAYPRPDVAHISFTLPLLLPLAVYCAAAVVRKIRPVIMIGVFVLALVSSAPIGIAYLREAAVSYTLDPVDTPRGKTYFTDRNVTDLLNKLKSEPGSYFFYPYSPMLPYLTALPHVAQYDVFLPYYTTAEQYRRALAAVTSKASHIVVSKKLIDHDFIRQIYPAMPMERDATTEIFERCINQLYTKKWISDEYIVLQRNTEPLNIEACSVS